MRASSSIGSCLIASLLLSRSSLLLAALGALAVPRARAVAAVLDGVRLIDGKAAVQIVIAAVIVAACRAVGSRGGDSPRSPGQPNRDRDNPDAALRQRRR